MDSLRRAGRGLIWTALTVLSISAAIGALRSPEGAARIAGMSAEISEQRQVVGQKDDVKWLAETLVSLRQSARDLGVAQGDAQRRIAILEEQLASITGSIPRKNAETAPRPSKIPEQSVMSVFSSLIDNAPAAEWHHDTSGPTVLVTQFGVEIASAADMATIERNWRDLLRDFGDVLNGLEPRIELSRAEHKPALLLTAGPLRNAADAARICVALQVAGKPCRAMPLSGEGVALAAR